MIHFSRKLIFIIFLCAIITGAGYAIFQKILLPNKSISGEFFDSKPTNEHISYVYAPGMMASELLMGRYCPEYIASTGEKIKWKSGGHVIGKPHSAVIFAEIDLRKPNQFTLNPFRALVNSLRCDLFPFIQRIFQDCYNFSVEDNPASDTSVVSYSFNLSSANLGQRKDIDALCRTYLNHLKKYPETNVILFGDSRGAASIFNFLATHKPKHVKAAIMDSAFDSVPHCIRHFVYDDKEKRCEERLHNLMNVFMGSYNKKGPFPRDYVSRMSDDIPLLFVTSLKDGLVAPQCTMHLYKELKKRGFNKIHLLVLKKSLHPCYMVGDSEDQKNYESVVHAFYKHYNLPYNKQKAQEGYKAFLDTQPSIQEFDALYQLPKCEFCK